MIDMISGWIESGGYWVLLGFGAVLCVVAVVWARSALQLRQALAGQLADVQEELQDTLDDLTAARDAGAQMQARLAAADARASEKAVHHREEIARLNQLHGELKKDFQALASETFLNNQKAFLEKAEAVFKRQEETLKGSNVQQKDNLAKLLAPMSEQLKRYEDGLKAYDTERQKSFTALKTQLGQMVEGAQQMSKETARLVNALRANPKTRGRWGEETLRNILELAGMSPYTDFEIEKSVAVDDGRLRPDVVLRLPGGRNLVIDAKVALDGYLQAVDAQTDAERETHLEAHAKQLEKHVSMLAGKDYWTQFENSPDFVVMFVPGENFVAAAAERRPDLFRDAFKKNVVITTPATLVALAKSVAYGWRQEKLSENARDIAARGADLYKRMQTMGGHIVSLGKSLDGSVDKYNKFVGSLERSVFPQARKLSELEVATDGKGVPELSAIERDTVEPVGKDLLVEPVSDAEPLAQIASRPQH